MKIMRSLLTSDGVSVHIYLEGPEASGHGEEHFCILRIIGDGISECRKIYGIDQFQAVILSLRHMRLLVEQAAHSIAPRELFWDAGDNEDVFGLNP